MDEKGNDEMVTVFKVDDPALLPVVESLLQASDLPYFIQGSEAFHLYPVGVAGPFSKHGLAARVLVPADRAEEATELLSDIEDASTVDPGELGADDEE